MAKWRVITEKSPKPGQMVLVCGGAWQSDLSIAYPADDTYLVTRPSEGARWSETGGEYYASWIENPTHWQPCPEPFTD